MRKPELLISLSIIANTIGSGSEQKLITREYDRIGHDAADVAEVNISSKVFAAHKLVLQTAACRPMFKNDSDQPSSGRYENMNTSIISGSDMKNPIRNTGLFTHGLCRLSYAITPSICPIYVAYPFL